jgi:cytochrome c551/c552
MKITKIATLLAGMMIVGLVGCEYVTIEPKDVVIPDTPVDFVTEIEPIFSQAGCTMCHTSSNKLNLTAGKAYTAIMNLSMVDTVTPANSKLLKQINDGHNSASVTEAQKTLILKWITEGAVGEIVPVSYATEVEPIWAKYNCTMCHGGSTPPDLRKDKSYDAMISKGSVVAKNLASPLVQKIDEKHNGAGSFTPAEKDLIKTWILQGALKN